MDSTCDTFGVERRLKAPQETNWNLPLGELTDRLNPNPANIYVYIVRSIDWNGRHFEQRGSAPNSDGGFFTLCTCKHHMRTFRAASDWPNTWIAGFTAKRAVNDRHFLVYLMQIGWAFSSHRELWKSSAITFSTKLAKATHTNPRGDLYEPSTFDGSEFDPTTYKPPLPRHSHAASNDWHKDVAYEMNNKRPALLVGAPDLTFVWEYPSIFYAHKLPRSQKRLLLPQFLENLRESHWDRDMRGTLRQAGSCSIKNSAGKRRRCGSG